MARSLYNGDFEKLTMRDISSDLSSIARSLARIQKNLDDLVETIGYLVPESEQNEEVTIDERDCEHDH